MSHGDREQTSNSIKKKTKKKHCFWIHYWEEWVSWLTGIKRNRGCTERVEPTWCCHGNHIPLWRRGETNLERVRAEDRKANTHKHTTSSCLSLSYLLQKEKKKKGNIMVEQLQFLCHPSRDWLLLQLSKWPCSNLNKLFPTCGVCVKHMTRYLCMVCIAIGCCMTDSSRLEATTGWQIPKYLFLNFVELEGSRETRMCVCVSVCLWVSCRKKQKTRACEVVNVSETIGDASHLSPSVWRRRCRTDTKPHLHLVALAPTAHQTGPITA